MGIKVENSFQNNKKQKIFLSVFTYHINRYIYIYRMQLEGFL